MRSGLVGVAAIGLRVRRPGVGVLAGRRVVRRVARCVPGGWMDVRGVAGCVLSAWWRGGLAARDAGAGCVCVRRGVLAVLCTSAGMERRVWCVLGTLHCVHANWHSVHADCLRVTASGPCASSPTREASRRSEVRTANTVSWKWVTADPKAGCWFGKQVACPWHAGGMSI